MIEGLRVLVLGWLMAAGCSSCVQVRTNVGFPQPHQDAVAAIEAGVTTRQQVVALLGPPEEWRAQALTDDSRIRNGPGLRVADERELFRRRRYTYARERRRTGAFLFPPLPIFPFFQIYGRVVAHQHEDSVVVLFDDQGVVENVGTKKEIDL